MPTSTVHRAHPAAIAAALAFGIACCPADRAAAADFHVTVDGDDGNPGTAAAPFASLARARDAVRGRIAAGLSRDILVEIGGGTYPVTETISFGPEDSGTEAWSITYAAAAGETVVLDGGRRIGGWREAGGGGWTTVVPGVREGRWYPRQLFIDGQRAIRARTPNRGWCEGRPVQPVEHDAVDQVVAIRIDTDGGKGIFGWAREFEYEQVTPEAGIAAWTNAGDVELVSLRHNEGGRKRLKSVDPAAGTVTLSPPHRWAPKCFGNDWFNGVPDGRCYLENAAEFLDSPGEWYLDRTSGMLTYRPRPGEDPGRWVVVAPIVQGTLVSVAGTRERPVVNLHFRGLHVEHVDWLPPPEGYGGLFCCNVPVFRDDSDPGHRFIEAAVEMTHARSCSFRDGGVARVGGMGIVLREGTADIALEGNHVRQAGAGGLGLGQCNVGFGYLAAAPHPEPGEYERFRVCNNHIEHCGLDYFGAVGIALFRMKDSIIAHNLVHHTAYCGIVVPGDQDPAWGFVGGNVLERNHVHHDMLVTQDGAGLYSSFAHRGTLIRANVFHDSGGNPMSGGMCLDGCTGITFDRNVVYRNPALSLVIFRPVDLTENEWRDNLVMPARKLGVPATRPKTLFDGRAGWELVPGAVDHVPPAEFLEALDAYVGLEPAYRERLEGVEPRPCRLHVLDDGVTWQLDLPEQRRGVVSRIFARAGKQAAATPAPSATAAVTLRGLDPAATYELRASSGPIEPTPSDSSVTDFTAGAPFPMVHAVAAADALAIPATATGRDLMDRGLVLGDAGDAVWVAYRRTGPPEGGGR